MVNSPMLCLKMRNGAFSHTSWVEVLEARNPIYLLWWIDGVYFSDEMYRQRKIIFLVDWISPWQRTWNTWIGTTFEIKSMRRWLNGKQYHVLNFLGEWWGKGQPRFPDNLVAGYTEYVNDHEGVVTWDLPLTLEGLIPDAYMKQLRKLRDVTR